MKTATLPSIRVEPEFRDQLEGVLAEGETLSSFMEKAVRDTLRRRQVDAEFHARGLEALASWRAGEEQGIPLDEVMAKLEAKLDAARQELARRKRVKAEA